MDEVRTLFREYEEWLGFDLCFQNFEEELRTLPGKYAPPDGRLLIAEADGKLAGTIALRRFADDTGEIKRLYVRPGYRGHRFGDRLIGSLIAEARSIGYRKLVLDTHPAKMGKAGTLYRSHGFRAIKPYYTNPIDGVIYMALELSGEDPETTADPN